MKAKPSMFGVQALARLRRFARSAGFQPAVSPISNRLGVRTHDAYSSGLSSGPQAGSPAIQQVGNLRYKRIREVGLACSALCKWAPIEGEPRARAVPKWTARTLSSIMETC